MFVGDVSGKANSRSNFVGLSRAPCFVIEPTAFSSQDKLRKLTLWMQSAQERICFNQSDQVLSRLNGTKRKNVIGFDAIIFSNRLQISFVSKPSESRMQLPG
jgi:hypothetical protein